MLRSRHGPCQEAYRLGKGDWTLIATDKDSDRARIEPFDAIELDLGVLWADVALPTGMAEQPAQYLYDSP